MKLHWTDWAAMTVIAGAGCVAIYAGLRSGLTSAMRRAVEERQRDMERQLNAMATTVKALQARVAELSRLQTRAGRSGCDRGARRNYGPSRSRRRPSRRLWPR